MLDERTGLLLKIINKKCAEGSYKVMTVGEFILDFPIKYGADEDLIRQMINVLSAEEYIVLKYDSDGEFCLSPTPKGRLYTEEKEKSAKKDSLPIKNFLFNKTVDFLVVFIAVTLALIVLRLFKIIC